MRAVSEVECCKRATQTLSLDSRRLGGSISLLRICTNQPLCAAITERRAYLAWVEIA